MRRSTRLTAHVLLLACLAQVVHAAANPTQLLEKRTRWRPKMEFEVGRLLLRNDLPAKRAEGVARLEQAARAGHAIAAVFLGYASEAGLTGKPSLDAALAWYRRAATAGDRVGAIALESSLASQADARLSYGHWYNGKRIAPAEYTDYFDWIRKKAAAGDPRHQYILARLLEEHAVPPARVDRAHDEAERLYRRAAANGHPEAAFQLWNDYKEHCHQEGLHFVLGLIRERRYERKSRKSGSRLYELFHSAAPAPVPITVPPAGGTRRSGEAEGRGESSNAGAPR